jgi:hypothetical protein
VSSAKLPEQALKAAVAALHRHRGNVTKAANSIGLNRSAFQHRIAEARRRLPPEELATPAATPETEERERLLFRIQQLDTELTMARKDAMTTAAVRHEIFKLRNACSEVRVPKWADPDAKHNERKKNGGLLTPMTIWSDWHWGETIEPGEVNGINHYDLPTARARAERVTQGVIDLSMNHTVHGEFPGIVVLLGGDMVSGTIHDELNRTNAAPIMPVVVDLFSTLLRCLKALRDAFGHVFVAGVAGNHGRTTVKPMFKQAAYLSYDWLLYAMLEKHFEDDGTFEFLIPDGTDAYFKVWNHRFLLTHGDKLGTAGGDGIIGMLGPVMRGLMKTRNGASAIGLDFDTMAIGHWHTYLPLPRVIANGSLIGHNEYAQGKLRAVPERPQQALWFNHPQNGTVMHMPVFAEANKPADVEREWIHWAGKPKRAKQ